MIARVYVTMPFAFSVPLNEVYKVHTFRYKDFIVNYYPPNELSGQFDNQMRKQKVTINSVESYSADVLRVDFIKHEFNREEDAPFDPTIEDISYVVNDLLARMRYVLSATQLRALELQSMNFQINYLNDDESEIEGQKGFIRSRVNMVASVKCTALTKEAWESVGSLEPFKDLPIWKMLLLDAQAVLPQIGPAVILTFTALEVFISKTLDGAAKNSNLDQKLWSWINNRGFFLKAPSIEEQYDFLSKHIIGISIKNNQELWVAFKNIQKARNSFAHTGICKLDNKELTISQTLEFIAKASEIISFIRTSLPESLHWPEFNHMIALKIEFLLMDPEPQ